MKKRGLPLKNQLVFIGILVTALPTLVLNLVFYFFFSKTLGESFKPLFGGFILIAVFISLAFILLTVLTSLLVARGIANPLLHLEHIIQRIASGDMTERVGMKSSLKELNRLSDTFDESLIESFHSILGSVKEIIKKSGNVSEAFSMHVEETIVSITQITSKINAIKEQIGKLDNSIAEASSSVAQILAGIRNQGVHIASQTSAVTETSAAIEEMSASIDSVARIAQEKRRGADSLVGITAQGEEKVVFANKVITETAAGIDDILAMINVINAIAAQTNLLAMNAAIEAAHAGEYGRGFAVVATEIRRLAESTATNAKKISNNLKGYVDQIKKAMEASQGTKDAFGKIKEEVQKFVDAFGEISSSTSELAAGTTEIVKGMNSLMNLSQEINDGSAEMTKGAEEINEALLSVKSFSQDTVRAIDETVMSTQAVTWAQNEISKLSIENNRNVQELEKQMMLFKLSKEEKERTKQNLNIASAIMMHQNWTSKMRLFIDGREELSKHEILDHTKCEFGRWFYSSGKDQYGREKLFLEIGEEHEALHAKVKEVYELKLSGPKEATEQAYNELIQVSRRVVALLNKLRDKVKDEDEAAGDLESSQNEEE